MVGVCVIRDPPWGDYSETKRLGNFWYCSEVGWVGRGYSIVSDVPCWPVECDAILQDDISPAMHIVAAPDLGNVTSCK